MVHAAQALNLRKAGQFGDNRSVDAVSRVSHKKSNIKEILVRNFFRKYPIDNDKPDMQQLQIEREAATKFESYVQQTREITTRNLTDFEVSLAGQLELQKRSATGGGGSSAASPIKQSIAAAKKNRYTMGQGGQPLNTIGNKSQRTNLITSPIGDSRESGRRNFHGHGSVGITKPGTVKNNNFSLPKISNTISQRELHEKPDSTGDMNKSAQRRSQIVQSSKQKGSEEAAQLYQAQQNGRAMQRGLPGQRTLQHSLHQGFTKGGDAHNMSRGAGDPFLNKNQPGTTKFSQNKNKLDATAGSLSHGRSHQSGFIGATPHDRNNSNLSNIKRLRQPGKQVGAQGPVEVDDIPSDISADEWGEIQKFGEQLHQAQIRKVKEDHKNRVQQVRGVLDQQVRLREELRAKEVMERKEFDRKILDKARIEMEEEAQKRKEKHGRVLEQKKMRDRMMEEAKTKQQNELKDRQNDEKARVMKLAMDLEAEKVKKERQKVDMRQAAMKVIVENKAEKKKRMADDAEMKRKDAEDVQKMIKKIDDDATKREEMIKAREKKIQDVMDRMGDAVVHRDKEMQKKQEREYIKQCIEKDEQAHLQDINKKMRDRNRAKDINEALTAQMREKKLKQEGENRANVSHMNKWMETMDADEQVRVNRDRARKAKIADNQAYLRVQIDAHNSLPVAPKGADNAIVIKKKYGLGGLMDPEEARMNRGLLKEIAKIKRGEAPSDAMQRNINRPI